MESPEEVIPRWQDAWNAGDPDGLAALFAEDAEFVNVVGLWWHTRSAMRQAHAYGLSVIFPGSTMTMRRPRVRHVGESAAVVQTRWRLVGQVSPAGEETGQREGVITFVLEERPEGWVVVAAQNTDRVQGAETHAVTGAATEAVSYREQRPPPAR